MSLPSNHQDDNNFNFSGKSDLELNESILINYNINITNIIYKNSKIEEIKKAMGQPRVLDFGAGQGTLTDLISAKTKMDIECVEIDPSLKAKLFDRGFKVCDLNALRLDYDLIFSSNVLEHIEDDLGVLTMLAQKIKPNGVIVIYVPALMMLFSDLDTHLGHFRRYSRRELIDKVERAGLKVVKIRYADSLGFFASIVLKIFGYRNNVNLGGETSLKIYDKFIFPVSLLLDNIGFNRLFGKNLYIVATTSKRDLV